ncbi:aldehyde dehydrogenase family protein [Onchocerca flexuosa]|uniref:Aldehyde dehydrogenase n=1 Tax=Onchocerca flexuosa TaxID=387005 RepID=A0A238BW21_9BILA|nr:aldehyde dehydrogenase family protein [Onchocerca flexuosa]
MATVIQHDAPYHELVEKQRVYFSTGITTKLEYRRKQLLNLKQLLSEETDVLTKAVYNDLKRSSKLTYSAELSIVFVEIDYMLDNLEQWSSPEPVKKTLLSLLDTVAIVKEPLGVVLIIAPWNYPLSLVLLPLVAAVAAGNTIVVKPSEYAPFTSAALHDLFSHFFDSRFLTVVNGGIAETTNLLKERFDYILYTGNPLTAKVIMAAAAQHLTPVTLELGGKSPVIVESDANLEVTSRRIVWGKWTNCGQTCISPDYVLVTETLKTALVNEFIQRLEEFYGSEPEKSNDYSRIINAKHFECVIETILASKQKILSILLYVFLFCLLVFLLFNWFFSRLSSLLARSNGQILYQGGKLNRNDLFIPPIIIAVSANDALMEEEIFGPILPIIATSGFDEAISFIRSREKPLAIYCFTRSERKVQQLYAETSSGSVTVNDVMLHFLIDTLPFGGVGQSGMGRYRGKFGFDTFTNHKALLIRSFFGDSLLAMRYPPLTDKKFKHLKLLIERRRPLPSSLPNWLIRILFLVAGVICGVALQRYGIFIINKKSS